MASIGRVITRISGFVGGDGYLTMYFTGASAPTIFDAADAAICAGRVRTFLNALAAAFPGGSTWQVLRDVAVLESTSGQLAGAVDAGAIAVVNGTGTGGTWARGAGALASWRTGTVVNGRLLRGRSFLTPLALSASATTGDVASGTVTSIGSAGTTLYGGTTQTFVIWHRPTPAHPTGGLVGPVTAVVVPVKPSILRSRRD